jgi:hypothetical protein
MPKNPAQLNTRYEVITQEDPVTGDLILPIPPQILESLGWKEGDELNFQIAQDGKTFYIEKKDK